MPSTGLEIGTSPMRYCVWLHDARNAPAFSADAAVEAAAVESIGGDFGLRRLDQREQIAAGGQIAQQVRRCKLLCAAAGPAPAIERDDDEGWSACRAITA